MSSLLVLLLMGTWDRVQERRIDEGLREPAAAARAAYAELVRDLARAAPTGTVPSDAPARAAALDLELLREGDRLWLRERADAAWGGGVLALRLGPLPQELVLQAPHPRSDLHSGLITGSLFDAGGIRAASFATAQRDASPDSDVAHNPETFFQSASDGLAEALPDPLFVQLHGFGQGTSTADAVISAGSGFMTAEALSGAIARLERALGVDDLRTGEEVPALAGRENAQGRLLAGRARFLHVELSLPLRLALRDDAALRASFAAALSELARREVSSP